MLTFLSVYDAFSCGLKKYINLLGKCASLFPCDMKLKLITCQWVKLAKPPQ